MYRAPANLEEEAQNPDTSPERLIELAQMDPLLALLVAENPTTPSGLLFSLTELEKERWPVPYHSWQADFRRIIAKNPNTPLSLLSILYATYPNEAKQNPSYPLLLLESPEVIEGLREGELLAALKEGGASQELLEEASLHPSARCRECAAAAVASLEALLRLAQDPEGSVRGALALRRDLPEEVLTILSKDSEEIVRESVAAHSNTAPAVLAVLSQDPEEDVRLACAKNPHTPTERLFALLPESREMRLALAQNPKSPTTLLSQLTPKDDAALQSALAKNPSTPPEMLRALVKIPEVFTLVARNPGLPEDLFEKLLESGEGRLALSQNPLATPALLEPLLLEQDSQIRLAAAQHPKAPKELLSLLQKAGASSGLGSTAEPDLSLTPRALVQLYNRGGFAKVLVAAHPNTPAALLGSLQHDPSEEVRLALLKNPSLPQPICDALGGDPSVKVREVAARRCSDVVQMRRLASDFFVGVRVALAQNPKAPGELQAQLARDSSIEVRHALAESAETPASVLSLLAEDRESLIRSLVVQNPSASSEVLYKLTQDPNLFIQKTARQRLGHEATPSVAHPALTPKRSGLAAAPTDDPWKIAREVLGRRVEKILSKGEEPPSRTRR